MNGPQSTVHEAHSLLLVLTSYVLYLGSCYSLAPQTPPDTFPSHDPNYIFPSVQVQRSTSTAPSRLQPFLLYRLPLRPRQCPSEKTSHVGRFAASPEIGRAHV